MIVTTTPSIEGMKIMRYHGIVTGEAIMGANIFRDILAGITDVIGGRSGVYEDKFRDAKEIALAEMSESASSLGANAVIGIDLHYETVGMGQSILMVAAAGTAVTLE